MSSSTLADPFKICSRDDADVAAALSPNSGLVQSKDGWCWSSAHSTQNNQQKQYEEPKRGRKTALTRHVNWSIVPPIHALSDHADLSKIALQFQHYPSDSEQCTLVVLEEWGRSKRTRSRCFRKPAVLSATVWIQAEIRVPVLFSGFFPI